MKKLTLAVILAGTIGGVYLAGTGAPVYAADANCKVIEQDMIRPDSAEVGPAHNWATDTFHRKVTICVEPVVLKSDSLVAVESATFSIVGHDAGTFVTQGIKSFKNNTMLPGVNGTFTGDWIAKYTAPYDSAHPTVWPFYNPTGSNADTTSEWLNKIWSQGAKGELIKWEWDYATCNEKLTNASSGNSGDITGKSYANLDKCLVVTYKVTCANKVDVTIVNKLVAGVKVKVNGSEKILALGMNTYTGVTTSDGWLNVTIDVGRDTKTLFKVKCIKPTACPTQTPSATPTATPTVTIAPTTPPVPTDAVPTTGAPLVPGQRLALTGSSLTPKLFVAGAVAILGGALILLFLALRNRRERHELENEV